LFPCLVDMKFKGVRVDLDKAAALKQQLGVTEKKLYRDINKIAGFEIEIYAATSIAKAFDKLKIPYDRTTKAHQVLPKVS